MSWTSLSISVRKSDCYLQDLHWITAKRVKNQSSQSQCLIIQQPEQQQVGDGGAREEPPPTPLNLKCGWGKVGASCPCSHFGRLRRTHHRLWWFVVWPPHLQSVWGGHTPNTRLQHTLIGRGHRDSPLRYTGLGYNIVIH